MPPADCWRTATRSHRLQGSRNEPPTTSFPSGHAQSAVVSYSLLLLLFWNGLNRAWRRAVTCGAVLVVLGIGLSRVALSVHYVSDVLAGYALGAAWVVAMTAAFDAWRHKRPSTTPST
ncbi:phosphatase PAP2 family protein [Lentzea sp. NPDC102401]|uniref:phosphatase PAP2 family protein n=1 Tax=Lentzea sp. NPDC102401 TaxID=3364128 RepID=UPI0037F6313A